MFFIYIWCNGENGSFPIILFYSGGKRRNGFAVLPKQDKKPLWFVFFSHFFYVIQLFGGYMSVVIGQHMEQAIMFPGLNWEDFLREAELGRWLIDGHVVDFWKGEVLS